jgi:hypothetical protein
MNNMTAFITQTVQWLTTQMQFMFAEADFIVEDSDSFASSLFFCYCPDWKLKSQ